MKKLISIALLVCFMASCGGGGQSASSNESSESIADSTPVSSSSVSKDATDIEFLSGNPSSEFNCNMVGGLMMKYKLTPSDAQASSVTWSSSNPDAATVQYGKIWRGTKAGITTITATLTNGVQKSFEFEMKGLAKIDGRLGTGNVVTCSSVGRVTTHSITEMEYGWYYNKETYEYTGRMYFTAIGEKLSDTKGDDSSYNDWLIRLSLINNSGITVDTASVLTGAVMVGDKYEIKETFYDAPISGAPYTIRVTPYYD